MAGARNPLKGIIFWTAGGLLALTVIFLAAVGVFLAMFDANRYKPEAVAWVQAHKNRTLAFDGPIELKVFPTLSIAAHGVSLSERGRPDVFARVAEAELSVRLVPLVQGRIEVGRVKARGVSLVYARRADGSRNIDDLLGRDTQAATRDAGSADPSSEGLADLDIAGVDLRDVAVVATDEKSKLAGQLTLERFEAGRIAPGVETPIELAAAAHLTRPEAQGRLALQAVVRYARSDTAGAPGTLTATGVVLDFDGASGGRTARTRLEAAGVQFTGETLRTSPLTLALSLGGGAPVDLQARTGSVEGTRDQLRVPGLTLDLQLGAQALSLAGDVEIESPVVKWSLSGDLKGPGIDGPVASSGRYATDSGTLDAKAEMAVFDIDAWRAGAGSAASASRSAPASADKTPSPQTASPPADPPIDFTPASAFKGTLQASIGTLIVNAVRLGDVSATLQGDGQRLDLSPFSARVWGGQLQGSGSVVPASQRMTLAAAARGIRVEQALRDLAHRENVRGVGHVDVALQAQGATVQQMKRSLAGKAKLSLRDGAVKGFDLAHLGRQAKAALGLEKDETKKADARQQTDFSSIDASFVLQNGVAHGSDLDGRSPYLRVSGEGAIDLAASTLDYTAYATVTDTSKGQGGAAISALKGLKVPVRLTGPLSDMNYQVQWSAVGTALAKQAIETKLDEAARGKLEGKLRDKLKGLFR